MWLAKPFRAGWDQGDFECRVGSWMAQQVGAHKGLQQRSSRLTEGGNKGLCQEARLPHSLWA